jgi:hypothetical protein
MSGGSSSSSKRTIIVELVRCASAKASRICWNRARHGRRGERGAEGRGAGCAGHPAARDRIRKHERRDRLAALAAEDDVLCQVTSRGEERRAKRPDADPGARRQFEVVGNAPFEDEAARRIRRVVEGEGIAHAVEPFFVEHFARERLVAPVARRDVRPAQSRFEHLADGRELQLDAGHGTPTLRVLVIARPYRARMARFPSSRGP